MKYGTLTNMVYAEYNAPELPKVGDGATLICWSDRKAYTVVGIKKKYLLVTRDIAERIGKKDVEGAQEYKFSTDLEAEVCKAYLRKDGNYYLGGLLLKVGFRDEYFDYSF